MKTKTKQIREVRRQQAEARQAEYDQLTIAQKIAKLPPEPHAARQRARLAAQLKRQA